MFPDVGLAEGCLGLKHVLLSKSCGLFDCVYATTPLETCFRYYSEPSADSQSGHTDHNFHVKISHSSDRNSLWEFRFKSGVFSPYIATARCQVNSNLMRSPSEQAAVQQRVAGLRGRA